MRVLLTGGAGLIGSHVARHLLARGHEIAIVDDLLSGKRENVPEEHPQNPVSPYGVSKLAGEHYLHYYHAQYGLPYVALR